MRLGITIILGKVRLAEDVIHKGQSQGDDDKENETHKDVSNLYV